MPRCEIVALVPRIGAHDILVRAGDGDRLTLPSTVIGGEFTTIRAVEAIAAVVGDGLPVLRVGHRLSDQDGEPTHVTLELEGTVEAPPGFAWTDPVALLDDGAAPGWLQDVLPRWIERQAHGPGPGEAPWTWPGWYARASGWMLARLEELGTPALAPPRMIYSWGISMVLRAPTAAGDIYLKATSPVFAREATLTALLAEATPELVTRVAAVEPDEGWLLMHDLGGPPLGDRPQSTWAAGLEVYGRIQRAWVGRTDVLAAAGAERRTLADLAETARTVADRPPLDRELRADEREAWQAAVPDLVRACERLDALGPAPTISHGDLHPWNVAATPDGMRVFDWSDAAIAHPFLDLAVFTMRPESIRRRRSLRAAYLAGWRDAGLSRSALREAGELAIPVGSLYQVESYRRILTGLSEDDQGGMRGMTRSCALATIAALRDGIARPRVRLADA